MWAILSGIEGNIAAYEAVLRDLQRQRPAVTDLYLLGDVVGLRSESEELLARLQRPSPELPRQHFCLGWWEEQCLALHGFRAGEPQELQEHYGSEAVSQLWAAMSRASVAWLGQQHFGFIELDCLLIHGSSVSVREALTPETPPWLALDRLQRVSVNTLFCGRSGLAFEYQIQQGTLQTSLLSLAGSQAARPVTVAQKRVVGVGCVGRELGRGTYVLYDPVGDHLQFQTVTYPVSA